MFQIKPLSKAIQNTLLISILGFSTFTTTSVLANESTVAKQYNIPAGALDQVLTRFAAQSGISLAFDHATLSRLNSKGLQGNYSIESGLKSILTTHPYQAQKTTTGYILVSKSQPQVRDMGQLSTIDVNTPNQLANNASVAQLPAITVTADSTTTEGTGSYTTGKMRTATKLDLSIRETPQSVTVISQQMLQDKKIDDFETLMKNVTGISSNPSTDPRTGYYSRGFFIDYYQIDGIPTPQNSYTVNNYNMDKFDRIEIVKGANGLTSGAGNPAASINMVRKHANSKDFTGSVDASIGNWNTYKIKADLSTPLNEDGNIRGRLVASHKETDTFKDRYHQVNDLIYAVIDADITNNTILSVGASYELDDRDGAITDFPAFYSDGTRTNFSRSKNYSPNWLSWDTEIQSYFASVKHTFENGILLNTVYTHNDIDTKDRLSGYTNVWNNVNKDGTGLSFTWMHMPLEIKEDNIDIYSSIPFNLGARNHEIIAGFQYNKSESVQTNKQSGSNSFIIDNYLTSNGNEITKPVDTGSSRLNATDETEQTAFYFTGKFEILDDLKLILGSRLTSWENSSWSGYWGNRTYENKNELTPFAGLIYDINENHSIYTSYTDIFKPQNYKEKNGTLLEPVIGKNYEIGIKGEYFDQRLNAGLTLFRIKQDNVADAIDGVYVDGSNGVTQAYRGMDGVTSKGIELGISGKIQEAWDLSAGFTHFEAKESNGDKINTTTPRNNINLFTKYSVDDWSFGAGVNWKSKGFSKSGAVEITQASYATVDIMSSYEFNADLSAQFNINNLFDKKYYAGYSTSSYNYGDPLNGTISLKYKF